MDIMKAEKMKRIFSALVAGSLAAWPALGFAEEELACPSAESARAAFNSGEARSWPNYSEGPAARVQRQHPNTGLLAQAKYINWNSDGAAICQYYNHVGFLMTVVYLDYDRADVEAPIFWREEYVESDQDDDRPGREMLLVCMRREGDLALPSAHCQFRKR